MFWTLIQLTTRWQLEWFMFFWYSGSLSKSMLFWILWSQYRAPLRGDPVNDKLLTKSHRVVVFCHWNDTQRSTSQLRVQQNGTSFGIINQISSEVVLKHSGVEFVKGKAAFSQLRVSLLVLVVLLDPLNPVKWCNLHRNHKLRAAECNGITSSGSNQQSSSSLYTCFTTPRNNF